MKRIKFLSLALVCGMFMVTSCDKDDNMLDAGVAIGVVEDMYPGAVVIESEHDDGLVEVDIMHDGIKKSVHFNKRNEWLFTEYDVLVKNLLPMITDYISSNYPGYWIDDANAKEDANGIVYDVDIEKGNEEYKLFFDKDGNFVKVVRD